MSEAMHAVLWNAQQGHSELLKAWEWAKPYLLAKSKLVLNLRPETRSDAQNKLLHSRIGDVAKQLEWAGRRWDAEDWKRLLTSAWCRTRNEGVEMVPALDGRGFDVLYRRTSKLTKAECADLSEYIMAWGTEQGVQWCPASLGPDGDVLDAQWRDVQ